jgi:hypothetical protein
MEIKVKIKFSYLGSFVYHRLLAFVRQGGILLFYSPCYNTWAYSFVFIHAPDSKGIVFRHCIDKLICLMLKDEDTFEEGISERITMNLTELFFTKQFI